MIEIDNTKENQEFKETLSYGNQILDRIRKVLYAWDCGYSGWTEIGNVIISMPSSILKDIPEVVKDFEDTQKKIERMPNYGSSRVNGRYVSWKEERHIVEYGFSHDRAFHKIIDCLDNHKLLFIVDKTLETGNL